MSAAEQPPISVPGRSREVLGVFLRLGLTSFGGPLAHLGYFREEFVRRRGWLDESGFAQLLSLCQVLPGPTSSQLGVAIGWQRAGWRGALAAFVGFTLPSALLLFALALSAPRWLLHPLGADVLHGLKLVAVVVVAHGVYAMARTLTPDLLRVLLAVAAAALVLALDRAWGQPLVIGLGALAGIAWCRPPSVPMAAATPRRWRRDVGVCCALAFGGLLLAALWISSRHAAMPTPVPLAAAFYRAGALVFGGGHVVLPLLQRELVASGWMSADTFLAGYGAAQAMPGPMFALAAYLGASAGSGIVPGAAAMLALAALFAPGLLALGAALPLWQALAGRGSVARALAGINAVVVGVLAAALYDPLWRDGIRSPPDLLVVALGLVLMARLQRPALWVVAWCAAATLGLGALGR
ncbi:MULTISPECIES: chromate transporter [Xanthomonas]|uniref:chromate transporter n=1 Tax=Xanthomonas TaxID=338 RepID=UPI0017802367|nr:chromate transporter [Xanthomonas surreyensis]MBD7923310.1 chromate efflux transporter [Xanthomonas surreyensis]